MKILRGYSDVLRFQRMNYCREQNRSKESCCWNRSIWSPSTAVYVYRIMGVHLTTSLKTFEWAATEIRQHRIANDLFCLTLNGSTATPMLPRLRRLRGRLPGRRWKPGETAWQVGMARRAAAREWHMTMLNQWVITDNWLLSHSWSTLHILGGYSGCMRDLRLLLMNKHREAAANENWAPNFY